MKKEKRSMHLPLWALCGIPLLLLAGMLILMIADVPEYTVTLSPGYPGGRNKTETVEKRDTVPVPEEIFRPGYTFAGWWYKDTDGWRLWDFERDKVREDITLTARWERITYTIHLDANGGECDATEYTVNARGTFRLPSATKEGYYFAGWYCGEFPFDAGTYPWDGDCTAKAKWTTYPPGMTVRIGHFEQDGNPENGAEEIEWYVVDYKDGKYFLVSKYLLTEMQYAENVRDTAWETSLIRTYLNGPFFETAFSEQEQQYIVPTALPEGVTDRVFLLSETDIEETIIDFYMCIGLPSDHLLAQGLKVHNTQYAALQPGKIYQTTWYYLRGRKTADGQWFGSGNAKAPVRPAMWIDESYVNEKGETP